MWLRKSRVKPIKEALRLAEKAGISTTAAQLEAHQLAGGDPVRVVESTACAKQHGIPAEFPTLCALDLAGKDTLAVVKACLESKQHQFDTYSSETNEKIVGWTQDGAKVAAACTITYRLPVHHVFGWSPDLLQERLGAKLAVHVNTARDYRSLELAKPQHEAQLLVLAKEAAETVQEIQIQYSLQDCA